MRHQVISQIGPDGSSLARLASHPVLYHRSSVFESVATERSYCIYIVLKKGLNPRSFPFPSLYDHAFLLLVPFVNRVHHPHGRNGCFHGRQTRFPPFQRSHTDLPQDIFLYALIIPLCPFILQERSHVAAAKVAFWTSIMLAAYGGTFLLTAPVIGLIADRWRCRRGLLWFGLVILTGSTGVLYVATSLALLTVARALQGISAAIIWVVGLALLAQTAEAPKVGEALGTVCSALCLSLMLSPLLSGLVFERVGYHAVYAMAFSVIGCNVILLLLLIEKDPLCSASPTTATMSTPNSPTDIPSPTTVTSSNLTSPTEISSPTMLLDKTFIKRRDVEHVLLAHNVGRLTYRHLFQSRQVWACMIVNFVVNTVVVACDAILPLFVVRTFHWNALQVGLILFALYGPNFVLGFVVGEKTVLELLPMRNADSSTGKMADKYGTRWLMVAGLLISCPVWLLARLVRSDRIALLVAVLVLAGCGSALTLTAVMIEFSRVCGEHAYAHSYGLYNVSTSAALLVGPLCFGLLYEQAGWSIVTSVFSILCFISVVAVLFFIGRHGPTQSVGAPT